MDPRVSEGDAKQAGTSKTWSKTKTRHPNQTGTRRTQTRTRHHNRPGPGKRTRTRPGLRPGLSNYHIIQYEPFHTWHLNQIGPGESRRRLATRTRTSRPNHARTGPCESALAGGPSSLRTGGQKHTLQRSLIQRSRVSRPNTRILKTQILVTPVDDS